MPANPVLALVLALAGFALAESPARRAPLDTVAVHNMYLDGDFEQAIGILEDLLKSKAQVSHSDSVFIYRHLGVMYAASENTRERGKHYMYRLISAEPFSNILDMYASDMIYMIFKNVKDEYEAARKRLENMEKFTGQRAGTGLGGELDARVAGRPGRPPAKDTAAMPHAAPMPGKATAKTPEKKKSGRAAYYWLGGTGAVVAGLGVIAWIHAGEEPKTGKKVYGLGD
jgi:hypothetical protein